MDFWVVAAFIIGGLFGAVIMALMNIASNSDDNELDCESED